MIDIIQQKMGVVGRELECVESGSAEAGKDFVMQTLFPSQVFGFCGTDARVAVAKEEDLLNLKDASDLLTLVRKNCLNGAEVVSLSSGRNHTLQLLALHDLEQTVSKIKNSDVLIMTSVNEDGHYLILSSKISNPKMHFAISIDDLIASIQFTFDSSDIEVKSGILTSDTVH